MNTIDNELSFLGFKSYDDFGDVVNVIKMYLDHIECRTLGNFVIKEDIADYLKHIIMEIFNPNTNMRLTYVPINLEHPEIITVVSETIDWLLIKHYNYSEIKHNTKRLFDTSRTRIPSDTMEKLSEIVKIVKYSKMSKMSKCDVNELDNMMGSMSVNTAAIYVSNPNPNSNTNLETLFSGFKI